MEKRVPRTQVEDFVGPDSFAVGGQNTRQYLERMGNGVEYHTLVVDPSGSGNNTKEFTVPDGHYFVLGDNRDNSTDSRFASVGFIPRENFRGKATGIYWAKDLSRLGNLP